MTPSAVVIGSGKGSVVVWPPCPAAAQETAAAGDAISNAATIKRVRVMTVLSLRARCNSSPRRTGLWLEPQSVRKFLEMRRRHERTGEILRVVHFSRYFHARVARRGDDAIVPFGEDRIRTIRHAVLADVSWLQLRRHDFQ